MTQLGGGVEQQPYITGSTPIEQQIQDQNAMTQQFDYQIGRPILTPVTQGIQMSETGFDDLGLSAIFDPIQFYSEQETYLMQELRALEQQPVAQVGEQMPQITDQSTRDLGVPYSAY